jgi:drug/metabolite transporter (DMT)-like permease
MLELPALRYCAIITGTVLWDAGAVLQKKAVDGMPGTRLAVRQLVTSPGWMAGLLVTTIGWGLYVFGLAVVGVAAARTVTGGSYVVLAIFSLVFLRTRLRFPEWTAVALVTAGIVLLARTEPTSPGASAVPGLAAVAEGLAIIAVLCAAVAAARRWIPAVVTFAALSGLLSSAGDLMVKLILGGPGPLFLAACAAAMVSFYIAGFYLLSRAYKEGTVVAGIVLSDFTARVGAILLGAVVLGETVLTAGPVGAERIAGFLLVLGGSLLLGRFRP